MEDDKQRTLSQVKKELNEQKDADHDAYREGKAAAKAQRKEGYKQTLGDYRHLKLQRKADKRAAKEALLASERQARKVRRQDPQAWEDYKALRKKYHQDKREAHTAYRFLHRQAHKVHAAYHEAYHNEHLALQRQARKDRALAKEIRDTAKEFWRVYGMHRYPLMADIFDLAEEDRAEPNSRTPFSGQIRVEKDIVYKTVDGEELKMDVYYPLLPSDKPCPCVMDVPGGGWMIHNRPRGTVTPACMPPWAPWWRSSITGCAPRSFSPTISSTVSTPTTT